jgi:hypothetical protein
MITARSTALAVAHLADGVLEALQVLRVAATARSAFLHDRDTGLLAVIGDPLDARSRRDLRRLVERGPGDDVAHWMWPTIESSLAVIPAGTGYAVALVREDGPLPVPEALHAQVGALASRLPARGGGSRAVPPPPGPAAARCSFCHAGAEGARLVSSRGVAICDACVVLCQEALARRRAPAQARDLAQRAAGLLEAAQRQMGAIQLGAAVESLQGAESVLADLLSVLGPLLPPGDAPPGR